MRRQLCLDYLAKFIGLPYVWGGDNPLSGFDCSGLVVEGLKAVGVLPRLGDWTAGGLLNGVFHDLPRATSPAELRPGMLVFWRRDDGYVRHVEMVFAAAEGAVITIGASGGGSKTITIGDAIKADAYVKLRPVNAGWFAAVDPFQ